MFNDEKVPAQEKIFSLFEDHTDILIKGARDIEYGQKLNLSSGKSGLILNVVIEEGNPADTDRLLPMLERDVALFDQAPRQVAADGGYASGANLEAVKAMGVTDMAFDKKRGLAIADVIARRTLRDFWNSKPQYADAENPLSAWQAVCIRAQWKGSSVVKENFRSASVVGKNVVFNIAGNEYRLVANISYSRRAIFVEYVGTHKQYDAIDVRAL